MFINVTHQDAQDDAYHQMKGWSVSQWKKLPHDPESFYGYYVASPPKWLFEATPQMELGTNVHSVLLENKPFRCPPEDVLSKSGSRAGSLWKEYEASHSPLECISRKEASALASIKAATYADPKIRWCLETPGEVEYSMFGTHEETELPVRGRLDKWLGEDGSRIILDVKTMSCDVTNERLVGSQFLSLGYHWQAAAYMDMMAAHGKPCEAFFFICVKTSPPYTCCLWTLNQNDLELGQRRNRIALLDLRKRLESGDWNHARHGEVNYLAYPKYAFDDNTHMQDENTAAYAEFESYAN